jgi:ketosteroid isomerase-like protein
VPDVDEVARQVRAAEDRRYAAMVAGDLAALGELLSDQAVYTHSYGGRDTKQEWLDSLSSGALTYHSAEHTVSEVIVRGDAAVLVGEMHADVTSARGSVRLDNATVAVWGAEDGTWRLVYFQSTALPK